MIELTEADYERLCALPQVQELIETVELERHRGWRQFWIWFLAGIAATIATHLGLAPHFNWMAALAGSVIVFIVFLLIATWPLIRAGTDFKLQILEALTEQHGLSYVETGFEPPAYPEAHAPLFTGSNAQTFFDLVWGTDGEKRFAIYEASIRREEPNSEKRYFSGTIYAFQRREPGRGTIVMVPGQRDYKLYKPTDRLEPVGLAGAESLEGSFEVYSDSFEEAKAFLMNQDLRALLSKLREGGSVFLYVGPEQVLAAVTCPNRFEPGSMFTPIPPRERIHMVFGDVAESLRILNQFKSLLD